MNQLAPCVKFLITLAKLLVQVLVCKGDASVHSRRDGETRLMVFTVTLGDIHCGTPEDGARGPEVKALQEKLRTLHLMSSPASAHFDAATQEAVLTFQKRHPWLKVDAVVGPKTIAEINESISQLEGELLLERFAAEGAAMGMADLQANPRLGLALQRRLHGLGLYPGGPLLDGDFGSRSQSSLEKFCTLRGIDSSTPLQLTSAIVADVLKSPSLDQVFAQADQVETLAHVYHEMEIQAKATVDHLALLDMGANGSPFRESLYRCNEAIQQATTSSVASSHPQPLEFEDYPSLGSLPRIKSVPAAFFGPDIAEACRVS